MENLRTSFFLIFGSIFDDSHKLVNTIHVLYICTLSSKMELAYEQNNG